jgi:hypothetical protein
MQGTVQSVSTKGYLAKQEMGTITSQPDSQSVAQLVSRTVQSVLIPGIANTD